MTDTKYVPCPKCGTEIDERVVIHYLPECYAAQSASQPAPAAAALRVAGPDDAIVPLDALRVVLGASVAICNQDNQPPWTQQRIDEYSKARGELAAAIAAATPPEQHHA